VDDRYSSPNGCTHCGIEKQGHAQQWLPGPGWHTWTEPTQDQIKARMRARRAELLTAREV